MRERNIVKAIVSAVVVMATLNLALQIHKMYLEAEARQRLYEETNGAVIACKLGPTTDEGARFYIEFALIVAFVGSRLKKLKGRIVYVSGLIGAILIYVEWWKYYFYLAEMTQSELELPNIIYLHSGNYWDICIAASISLLLLREIGRLVVSPFRPRSYSN